MKDQATVVVAEVCLSILAAEGELPDVPQVNFARVAQWIAGRAVDAGSYAAETRGGTGGTLARCDRLTRLLRKFPSPAAVVVYTAQPA